MNSPRILGISYPSRCLRPPNEAPCRFQRDLAPLHGILSKSEYQELDSDVLGQLPRTLNPDELKKLSGDVFGRIIGICIKVQPCPLLRVSLPTAATRWCS